MTKHSIEWLEKLDADLARLARRAGALRLSFGLVLEALARRGGHHDLGFSSVEAYGLEQCERSARWIQQTRSLARRLEGLPAIRQGVVSGRISWSIADLLSRIATSEDESAWLLVTRGRTVRQLRELLEELRAGAPSAVDDGHVAGQMSADRDGESAAGQMSAGPHALSGPADLVDRLGQELQERPSDWQLDEPEKTRTLTVTVDQPDAWLFECARMLVGRMDGTTRAGAVLEALLLEGESSLAAAMPADASREIEADPDAAAQRAWEAQLEQWRTQAEARCEPRLAHAHAPEVPALEVPTLAELAAEGVEALDARLRQIAGELAQRDVEIGRLAESLWRQDGWRRLGYATARQYATERLGLSHSSVKDKRALARRLQTLPQVADAVAQGRMGYEAARCVTRVATESTSAAWVARAAQRTLKHLRGEVAATELLARIGDEGALLPPTPEQMDAVESLAANVMSGEVFSEKGGVGNAFGALAGASHRGRARVTMRLSIREGTYWHYKSRERLHRRYGPGGGFMRALCIGFIETWQHALRSGVAYEHVYARDRFECASPVCSRRDLTPHHLKFRAHGGGDEDENLLSQCVWCHLDGIHGGRLKAAPPASNVHWELGRTGHTVVEGRRKVTTPEAAEPHGPSRAA